MNDRDRPLNGRGRRAASRMGRLIDDQQFAIDLVLCSTSTRTRQTAELVFEQSNSPPVIEFRDDLYHAEPDQFVEILKQIAKPIQCVMLIAHNPGMEEFVEQLTLNAVHFPTAGLAQIVPDIDEWSSFSEQTRGRLVQLWRPKELDAG